MTLTKIASTGVEDSLRWVLGANGTSDYTFTGPGLTGTVNDPTIYLTRGHTYIFQNNSGGHPFYIKTSIANGGTNDAYNTGVTNNGGGNGTEIVFTVPHDSPDILYYQCSSHASMAGQFNIAGSVADGSITTAKIADDAVTDAKLANSINAAIAANSAKNTNATHTGDVTGSANLTIATSAVTTPKIADGAVTTAKIADEAVTLAKLEHGTSSNDGKFLRANNGADPTFESIPAGITVNSQSDNRVITATGTSNTLQAEGNFTHDATNCDTKIDGYEALKSIDLIVENTNNHGNAAGARITIQSGSSSNTGPQFGMICGSDNWYVQTPKNVGAMDFHKNGTRTFRLMGDGDVQISDGNLVIGTSGHGIDFSASGGPSGSGNELLDDYEEGTFTPTFTFSPTDVTNESYSIQTGHYVKVGRIVFFRLEVQLSNKGTLSSGAGYCQIGGLPIQSSDYAAVSIGIYQHFNNVQPGIAHVGVSEQVYIAYDPSLSSNTSSYDLQHSGLTNSTRINIAGTYYASS